MTNKQKHDHPAKKFSILSINGENNNSIAEHTKAFVDNVATAADEGKKPASTAPITIVIPEK